MRTITMTEYNGKQYKVCNDTYYHINTPDSMVNLLEHIRLNKIRVRFHWGDTDTGRDYGDMYDVKGTLGRTMGPVKSPILLQKSNSWGGGIILDHCIVKITLTTKPYEVLYQHPSYHVKY